MPSAFKAYSEGNADYIKSMAQKQAECGAEYLDINAAMLPDEKEKLLWAAENVLSVCGDAGLVIDSADPAAIRYVMEKIKARAKKIIINSVTLEKNRLEGILPLAAENRTGIVALPIENSMPQSSEERVENARKLIALLTGKGIPVSWIYLDIVVEAVSANWEAPRQALLAAAQLRKEYPELHLVAGLSNVSFGLPKRVYINSAFLSSMIAMGVDSAIMDITNTEMRMQLGSALMVNGQDEYCAGYLETYRDVFE
ncbi:MAG TPA: dihydropteroate synthase [Clostridia bacterium]|nr:dihydropteroate synthase [Clostridia bacterium]